MRTDGPNSSQKATSSREVKSWWFSMSSVRPAAAALGAAAASFSRVDFDQLVPLRPGRGAVAAEDRGQREADEVGAERLGVADAGVDVAVLEAGRDHRRDVEPSRAGRASAAARHRPAP